MRGFVLPALAVSVAIAGCSNTYEPLALHGAASMRVEIEAYKGPLSKSPEIQVGELGAVLAETARAMHFWAHEVSKDSIASDDKIAAAIVNAREIVQSLCALYPSKIFQDYGGNIGTRSFEQLRDASAGLKQSSDTLQQSSEALKSAAADGATRSAAESLRQSSERLRLSSDAARAAGDGYLNASGQLDLCDTPDYRTNQASANTKAAPPNKMVLGGTEKGASPTLAELRAEERDLVRRVAAIAGAMKSKSFRAADSSIKGTSGDRRVRGALADFMLLTSEYSNQIQSRLAVLDKQVRDPADKAHADRELMPFGDYLRDARMTDFVRLYEWLSPKSDRTADSDPKTVDRIRIAERLYNDYYWERVNEVYTSGQGDVAMAFIKDDLGNWNLKSFSNRPGELLKAYGKVADAALKTAVNLASRSVDPSGKALGAAQKALAFANQVATGEDGGGVALSRMDVSGLHARTAATIASRRQQFATRQKQLDDDVTKAAAARDAADNELKTRIKAAETAKNQQSVAQAAWDACTALAPNSTCPEVRQDALALAEARSRTERANDAAETQKKTRDDLLVQESVARQRLKDLPRQAVESVEDAFKDHLNVIATLEEQVTGPAAPAVIDVPVPAK